MSVIQYKDYQVKIGHRCHNAVYAWHTDTKLCLSVLYQDGAHKYLIFDRRTGKAVDGEGYYFCRTNKSLTAEKTKRLRRNENGGLLQHTA